MTTHDELKNLGERVTALEERQQRTSDRARQAQASASEIVDDWSDVKAALIVHVSRLEDQVRAVSGQNSGQTKLLRRQEWLVPLAVAIITGVIQALRH